MVSEIERRQNYLVKLAIPAIGIALQPLVLSCLDDNAAKCPMAEEISDTIKQLRSSNDDEIKPAIIPLDTQPWVCEMFTV